MHSYVYIIAVLYKMAFISWTIQHFNAYAIHMRPYIIISLMNILIFFYIFYLNWWWFISESTFKTNFSLYKAFDDAVAEFQSLK